MKKRLSMILGAIALLATSSASMGCIWILADEPNATRIFND